MMCFRTCAGIDIERDTELFERIFDDLMITVNNILRSHSLFLSLDGNGHSMLIRTTDKYYFFSFLPQIAHINIGRNINTGQMTDIFVTEFGRINTYFGQTFTEMFGGGKASLELEDRSQPLTCGIEIRVQPPGKQLKTITLLSGGEKAFVAIALYFAILKVRPTPFCMLDEIDAALDDRNVERFAGYLRGFSGKTQFIVITHRRGTMEAADVLYGVTMQEQGISRILHLDLNQMEHQLGISEEIK